MQLSHDKHVLLTIILDQRADVDTMYLDFAKAFDSVPHKRLLLMIYYKAVVMMTD